MYFVCFVGVRYRYEGNLLDLVNGNGVSLRQKGNRLVGVNKQKRWFPNLKSVLFVWFHESKDIIIYDVIFENCLNIINLGKIHQ